MYIYNTEILETQSKWFSNKANEADASELDRLLNARAADGWELVTYDYMMPSTEVKAAFIVTFRKKLERDE